MAVLNYLVFLPEEKGGLEYVDGWQNYGLTASIIILMSIYISTIGTHRHIPYLRQPPPSSGFNLKKTSKELVETLSNRSFFALFISALFMAVASGVATSLSVYFVRHFWELTSTQIGYLNLPYFLSALLALKLAPAVSKRLGKKVGGMTVLGLSFAFAPLPFILRLFDLFPENGTDMLFWTLIVFNTVEVTLIIAASALVSAMIADVVEDSEIKTGRRSEGIFFAANSFAQKAVNGLGVVVAGQILAIIQFPTGAKPGEIPSETVDSLAIYYIPVILVFYVVALSILSLYRINREGHEANLQQLENRQPG